MPGRLIAIEGIDGSGKGTQAKLLFDRLRAEGRRIALLSFPRYTETRFGSYIGEYLNGQYGTLDQIHPFFASLLFAGDRFESRERLLELLRDHDIVICDRYVASNVAHQGARIAIDERSQFQERIQAIEHGVFGLPQADLTILLDMSVANATRLIATKAKRNYTDRSADLHETEGEYLESVRSVYRALSGDANNWRIVPCEVGRDIRAIHDIAQDVYRAATA